MAGAFFLDFCQMLLNKKVPNTNEITFFQLFPFRYQVEFSWCVYCLFLKEV